MKLAILIAVLNPGSFVPHIIRSPLRNIVLPDGWERLVRRPMVSLAGLRLLSVPKKGRLPKTARGDPAASSRATILVAGVICHGCPQPSSQLKMYVCPVKRSAGMR